MKKIVIILAILLVLSLGCTEIKDDATVMLGFTKLKQDYGVISSHLKSNNFIFVINIYQFSF